MAGPEVLAVGAIAGGTIWYLASKAPPLPAPDKRRLVENYSGWTQGPPAQNVADSVPRKFVGWGTDFETGKPEAIYATPWNTYYRQPYPFRGAAPRDWLMR